jgi:hypothetical protein
MCMHDQISLPPSVPLLLLAFVILHMSITVLTSYTITLFASKSRKSIHS